MKRSPSRRKCRYCNQFFVPDPRTSDRQRYCSKPACRQASKAASQRRWLSRNGNGDYFRGPAAVARVQRWRQRHPGYWRRNKPASQGTQTLDIQVAGRGRPAVIAYDTFCRLRQLHDQQGLKVAQIAAELHLDPKTVERWLDQPTYQPRQGTRRPSKLDSLRGQIAALLERHCIAVRRLAQCNALVR